MPSSLLHRHSRRVPPPVVSGKGSWLTDAQGRRYLDACGGAAVSCIGHAHPRVIEAIARQAGAVEYAHNSFFTSEAAERLGDLLLERAPAPLSRVYFVSSGSEAMEAAIKLARQYFVERGESARSRIVSRRQSYHGNTLGALAVGGNVARRALYAPLLIDTTLVSPCFAYRHRNEGESDAQYVERLAAELERAIAAAGEGTVMAFVAETVVGATTGAVPPVAGYLRRMREVCDRHGVLLILDEVMCGAGRTGRYHAFEAEGVVPDILTAAKGLGGGYQPIGAVYLSERIDEAIRDGSGAFKHGHTYNAHPVACAAALAVQEVIRDEGLVERCAASGEKLQRMLEERFSGSAHVGDIRGRGLFRALEFVADRADKRPFDPAEDIGVRLKAEALRLGLCIYPGSGTVDGVAGDHVLLAPPFNISDGDLELAVDLLGTAVDNILPPASRRRGGAA